MVGFASTGSLMRAKKFDTFTSRSSSGKTYWLAARVSSVILSSKCVFTSVPMPKQNTRVRPALACLTFATIWSSSVLPTVGMPSVRKITTKGRSSPPGRKASARCNASSIAVPPLARSLPMNSSARSRFAIVASASLSNNGSTSVEKRRISKRSPSLRFSTQNCKAFFACSSFLPAMEPDVSSTNATSLGRILLSSTSRPGEASKRKEPSSSAALFATRFTPSSSFSGAK